MRTFVLSCVSVCVTFYIITKVTHKDKQSKILKRFKYTNLSAINFRVLSSVIQTTLQWVRGSIYCLRCTCSSVMMLLERLERHAASTISLRAHRGAQATFTRRRSTWRWKWRVLCLQQLVSWRVIDTRVLWHNKPFAIHSFLLNILLNFYTHIGRPFVFSRHSNRAKMKASTSRAWKRKLFYLVFVCILNNY